MGGKAQTGINYGNKLSEQLKAAGIDDSVKLTVFPNGQGKIIMRFTNLADLYDKDTTDVSTKAISIYGVITALYFSATRGQTS